MFRTQLSLSAICLSTICSFASVGLSQDFFQPLPAYAAPAYAAPMYSAPAYSAPSTYQPDAGLAYTVPLAPMQFPVSAAIENQFPADSSLGVPIETPGNYLGEVFIGPNGMPTIISKDYGYLGPGDMRTHLWNDHGEDLKSNGVSEEQLNAMPMATVQKWHNFFHGTEGKPE